MYADHAKLNRCKKLLETPVKVDRNKEPPKSRPNAGSVPTISRTSGTADASSLPAPMGKTETPPSEESRFGRRKSSARRWVV